VKVIGLCYGRLLAKTKRNLINDMSKKPSIDPKWHLSNLLSEEVVVGDILRTAILLEFDLGLVLTDFFVPVRRRDYFADFILDRLRFHEKIEIFNRLPLSRPLPSHQKAYQSLLRINRIRNFVAHGFGLRERELDRFCKDPITMQILSDYPKSLRKELILTRNRLWSVSRSKSFATSTVRDHLAFDDLRKEKGG